MTAGVGGRRVAHGTQQTCRKLSALETGCVWPLRLLAPLRGRVWAVTFG